MSDAVDEIKGAPATFSNWDKCMDKSYCKYPAIIGIVILVLVAVSILWCCVRCCCCGLSCCCGCLSCFNNCCPGPRGRKKQSKFADPPSPYPQPNPYMGYVPPSNPPVYNGPNTASFSVPGGRSANADSLPYMPTWKDGKLEEPARSGTEMSDLEQNRQSNGVVPLAGARTSKGGYSEIPGQENAGPQPGQYRGANTTHPYGSDLSTQGFASQNPAYGPSASHSRTDGFAGATAMPSPSSRSARPSFSSYTPEQSRPPSALQAGWRPPTNR